MNHIRKKDHVYDVVVIGAGLSGLIAASSLIRDGLDVCVLDAAEFAGGHSRLVYSPMGLIDNGIKFFPDTESCQNALSQLNQLLPTPIEYGAIENGPITYQSGEFKPFVGFGKEAPEFHRELSYFLAPRRLELSRKLGQVVAELAMSVGERFYPESLVTKYLGSAGVIHSVMVNGQKTIHGKEFIHATSPQFLSHLLDDELLSVRAKQKMAKAEYWTLLGLDLFNKAPISHRQELHLLNGTTTDEIGPCVGLFHEALPVEKEGGGLVQCSQWMTFVSQESSEDPEFTGAILKKIKRQIKRAYPEAMENLISERIIVAPSMEADLDLKFDPRGNFSGVKNLWLAHGSASKETNLVGSINQSLLVASKLSSASLSLKNATL